MLGYLAIMKTTWKKTASPPFSDERETMAYPIYKKDGVTKHFRGERWISLSDGGDKKEAAAEETRRERC